MNRRANSESSGISPSLSGGGDSALPQRGLGASLRHVHRLYIRLLQEHLAKRGLSVAQYLHLRVLWEGEGLPQNEISYRLGIEKASSTGALDALESDGLIRRVRDKSDRRRLLVFLSPKGEALRDTILPFAHQVAEIAGRGTPEDEMAILLRTIDRMIVNLNQELGKADR